MAVEGALEFNQIIDIVDFGLDAVESARAHVILPLLPVYELERQEGRVSEGLVLHHGMGEGEARLDELGVEGTKRPKDPERLGESVSVSRVDSHLKVGYILDPVGLCRALEDHDGLLFTHI